MAYNAQKENDTVKRSVSRPLPSNPYIRRPLWTECMHTAIVLDLWQPERE